MGKVIGRDRLRLPPMDPRLMVVKGRWRAGMRREYVRGNYKGLDLRDVLGFEGDLRFLSEVAGSIQLLRIISDEDIDVRDLECLDELTSLVLKVAHSARADFHRLAQLRRLVWESPGGIEQVWGHKRLESLEIHYLPKGIPDLCGAASCSRLRELVLSVKVKSIGDISQARELRRLVIARRARLRSLEGIEGAVGLEELVLKECDRLSDIEACSRLSSLVRLELVFAADALRKKALEMFGGRGVLWIEGKPC